MQLHFEDRLSALDPATLTPLVRQALANASAEVLDWQLQQLTDGGLGIYRFSGRARLHGETAPWSMVLKALANIYSTCLFSESKPKIERRGLSCCWTLHGLKQMPFGGRFGSCLRSI
jgi:hypothetical protein